MHTIYRIAAGLLLASACYGLVHGQEGVATPPSNLSSTPAANIPLSGKIEAAFNHDEKAGTWSVQVAGSYEGTGARVTDLYLYGTDAQGEVIGKERFGDSAADPTLLAGSPFTMDIPLQKPDPDWLEVGIGMRLTDATGSSTDAVSDLWPVIWHQPVLIDHAVDGSVVTASNYASEDVPGGIGIPHMLINGIPEGAYYAVVFFEGLHGCPSSNYAINSFRPHGFWGYDTLGPNGPYSKAFSSAGGGCMQQFYVDQTRGDGWLWGALSNTGTSSAIADAGGIPAFAVCATAVACDPIIPHGSIGTTSDAISSAVSNVLFLPGIKGSDLYEDNPLCLIPDDSCGIKVWLPLADAMVPELFLDAAGKSKRNIFVRDGDILASAFGQSFYTSFVRMLDDARAKSTFGPSWGWKTVAYDWRLSLPDIVENGAKHGSHIYFGEPGTTPYLAQELRSLASSSPTGKVTIIAHSNGGLVAKALLQSLGDTLSAQLIDSVVFVGVPQSGAPRALGALLYGDAEGIPGIKNIPNLIMSAAHAREFGLNSPMAYHLLPSSMYMNVLQPEHPLVRFGDSPLTAKERAAYGPTIDTENELASFARAEDGDRMMPQASDLTAANILNPTLLSYARTEHDVLDAWQPSPSIEIYELGGYAANTISGIDFYPSIHKDGSQTLSYRPLFTQDGDGTVPVISALMMNASKNVHHIWLDLASMRSPSASYSHANLLESPDVQLTLKDILQHSAAYPATAHAMDIPSTSSSKQFALYVHSPVSITVTDANGRKTSISEDETKEDIPGSTAGTLGEVKYVLVPTENLPYTLSFTGEGIGSFTLDMQELDGDDITATTTIADVPVTKKMRASLTISKSLADVSALEIDEDGDGTTDLEAVPFLGSTTFPTAIPGSSNNSEASREIASARPRFSAPLATPPLSSLPEEVAQKSAPILHANFRLGKRRSKEPIVRNAATYPEVMVGASAQNTPSFLARIHAFVAAVVKLLLHLIKTLGVRLGA